MTQSSVFQSFDGKIYAGLKDTDTGQIFPFAYAETIVQEYVNQVGQCFSVTRTEYIYSNGREPGVIVGLIHYPRFPAGQDKLKQQTLELAKRLLIGLKQYKVTVAFTDGTIMLSREDSE